MSGGGAHAKGSVAEAKTDVRLAELVGALSLGIDLGFGQPMQHVLRQCLISMRVCELADLGDAAKPTVYYTSLLLNVGCHSDAYEQAKWFGDDIALKAQKYRHPLRSPAGAAATLLMLGGGQPPLARLRLGLDFARDGHHELDQMITNHAELARRLAAELGLDDEVQRSLECGYEQWDGRGWPGEVGGSDIPVAARIAPMAELLEVSLRLGGAAEGRRLLTSQSGKQFDPSLASLLSDDLDELALALGTPATRGRLDAATWQEVIAAEPTLDAPMTAARLDAALLAIADFIDLKSPYWLGHSRGVARLAESAARGLAMHDHDVEQLRWAALTKGFGRLGVSNAIWDRAGPLTASEWERVRMQPYLTARMLGQSSALAAVGQLAAQSRERLDGSGYPHGMRASSLSRPARVLAVAESYQAMREPRPYRAPLGRADAAHALRSEVRAGRLDPAAVEAVLSAAGVASSSGAATHAVADLTPREIEVLVLAARGLAAKQIATKLGITPKTARNHLEHIYAKIGASNRAQASLFAIQHGLLDLHD